MFPIRYFAGRYFPGSYFPEAGSDIPTPPMGSIALRIAGQDRSDYLYYQSPGNWNLVRGQRGSCTLPLIVYPGDQFAPQVGEFIEIYDDSVRVWAGTIETVDVRWLGDDGYHVTTVTGVTLESLFDSAQVDKIQYTAESAGTIFSALFALAAVPRVSLGTVDAGPTIQSLQVTRISDAFAALALEANKIWFVDPSNLTLNFISATATAAPWTMTAAEILWESMQWKQSRSDFRDAQVVQLPDGSAQVTVSNTPGTTIGSRTIRLTLTSAFNNPGAIQEATAALARYSTLPAQLMVSTDKPGVSIGQLLTIAVTSPAEASGILDGDWIVNEVEGSILPGLDNLDEPWGHFRYTLRLVNSLATAVFQGDGIQSSFTLPITPGTTPTVEVLPHPERYFAIVSGDTATVTPAPEVGSAVIVTYQNSSTPDVPSFIDTLQQLAPLAPTAGPAGQDAFGPDADVYTANLTLHDLTVADDIADHAIVYRPGTAIRGLAVLRKVLGADLTVRINKNGNEIVTVTIPDTTVVDDVLEFDVVTGSPPITAVFADKDVLTADILESDGAIDSNGICSITIEWGTA